MTFLLIAFGVLVAEYMIHRRLVAAEIRGWIFNRQRPPRIQFLGLLEEFVQPSVEYLIEESAEAIRADHIESNQGPDEEDVV